MAAARLMERGRRVLLDKDRHPRFHIGESLLSLNLPLLEKVGVAQSIARVGLSNAQPNSTLWITKSGNKTVSAEQGGIESR